MQNDVSNHALWELYDTTFRITQNFEEILYDTEISIFAVNPSSPNPPNGFRPGAQNCTAKG